MKRSVWFRAGAMLVLVVALFALVGQASAQPVLVDASPAPGSTLIAPPQTVILTFDRILSGQGTTIRITDERGQRVDQNDTHLDPTNRFRASISLQTLIEGRYTVSYTVAAVGSSTVLVGSYEFAIDLPPPTLALIAPVDGQAFGAGIVPLQMQVQYFDFGLYNNRIRLYVDDGLYAELRTLSYDLESLPPGVHKITAVLAQFEDQELPETAVTVTIAITQPDPESEGREQAAVAPPDPGLQLTIPQLVGTILATMVLLWLGIWLGRLPELEANGSDVNPRP